eukprot:scaffold222811_cov42-Tisochrysis_lutea.AAC.1
MRAGATVDALARQRELAEQQPELQTDVTFTATVGTPPSCVEPTAVQKSYAFGTMTAQAELPREVGRGPSADECREERRGDDVHNAAGVKANSQESSAGAARSLVQRLSDQPRRTADACKPEWVGTELSAAKVEAVVLSERLAATETQLRRARVAQHVEARDIMSAISLCRQSVKEIVGVHQALDSLVSNMEDASQIIPVLSDPSPSRALDIHQQ